MIHTHISKSEIAEYKLNAIDVGHRFEPYNSGIIFRIWYGYIGFGVVVGFVF